MNAKHRSFWEYTYRSRPTIVQFHIVFDATPVRRIQLAAIRQRELFSNFRIVFRTFYSWHSVISSQLHKRRYSNVVRWQNIAVNKLINLSMLCAFSVSILRWIFSTVHKKHSPRNDYVAAFCIGWCITTVLVRCICVASGIFFSHSVQSVDIRTPKEEWWILRLTKSLLTILALDTDELNMYICAYLVDCKVNVVIPAIWVAKFDAEACFNHGINRNKIYKVFFSHSYKLADFDAPLRSIFSDVEDAVYRAKLCAMKCKYTHML